MSFQAFVFLFLFPPLINNNQDNRICDIFPQKDGFVNYSEVIAINERKSEDLYRSAKIWISKKFENPKDVIQTDIENSLLSINGLKTLADDKNIQISFSLAFQFKDGRYRYEISNIRSLIPSINIDKAIETLPAMEKCQTETLMKYDTAINEIISDFKNEFYSVNDDW
ncbi:MAG: DUF4468 domain-containing protein [Mariniphaga sp.]|nr:DUF4468 domain-containing protein [Mariniphaga sp.]